jgi:hypothetical protein
VNQGVQTRTFQYNALGLLKQASNPESGSINYLYYATINDAGLSQHVWWKKAVILPWEQVTGMQKTSGGAIRVFGTGKTIVLSPNHIDPMRFELEPRRRAKSLLIQNSNGPLNFIPR